MHPTLCNQATDPGGLKSRVRLRGRSTHPFWLPEGDSAAPFKTSAMEARGSGLGFGILLVARVGVIFTGLGVFWAAGISLGSELSRLSCVPSLWVVA